VSRGAALTFAIPFYRNIEFLRRAIDSVRAQSADAWSAIVCDDAGPEPEARDLVRGYDDERISYVRNEKNLGLGGNWNRCLELAPTDLVTLLHADDELLPGYAALATAAHREFPSAVAVYPRAQVIDADGRRAFSAPDLAKHVLESRSSRVVLQGEPGLRTLMRGQTVFCPALCYRKALVGSAPFSTRWAMVLDLAFLAGVLLDGGQLVGLHEVAYSYRRHTESQSAELTRNTRRFREELMLFDEIAIAAEARGWARAARTARAKRIVRLHLAYRASGDLLRGRGREAIEKIGLAVRGNAEPTARYS
jgi:glycosyltransferase involved in cell wall biosynthesis